MKIEQYKKLAARTEKVDIKNAKGHMRLPQGISNLLMLLQNRGDLTCRAADRIKREVYYHKAQETEMTADMLQMGLQHFQPLTARDWHRGRMRYRARLTREQYRLLHAGLGMLTESGEFLDMVLKHLNQRKRLDRVNLLEEVGDLCWYIALALNCLDVPWEKVLVANIQKLRSRYPDRFSDRKAVERDLRKERKILNAKLK